MNLMSCKNLMTIMPSTTLVTTRQAGSDSDLEDEFETVGLLDDAGDSHVHSSEDGSTNCASDYNGVSSERDDSFNNEAIKGTATSADTSTNTNINTSTSTNRNLQQRDRQLACIHAGSSEECCACKFPF